MDPLEIRAVAARALVEQGEITGEEALRFVVWPTTAVEQASVTAAEAGRTRHRSERERLQALELVDSGLSWSAAGRAIGVHKQTVGGWVKKRASAG
jgi:hypothetical protein